MELLMNIKIRNDEMTYGANDCGEFIEFDENHLFYCDNSNLHNFLVEKK